MWQQPNREYITLVPTYLYTARRAGAHSSLSSRAGPELDFFTPLNCAEMPWQVIRVVQCTFIVSWILGQSVALCPGSAGANLQVYTGIDQNPQLNSPNCRAGSELVGSTLLSLLGNT